MNRPSRNATSIAFRDVLDETCLVLMKRLKNCLETGPRRNQDIARLAAQTQILRDISRAASIVGDARRTRHAPGSRRHRALDDGKSPNGAEVARHRPAVARKARTSHGGPRRPAPRTVPMEIIRAVSDDLYDLDLPPDFGHERDRLQQGPDRGPENPTRVTFAGDHT